MADDNPGGFQTGFRTQQVTPGGPVSTSYAEGRGQYRSFYYEWLTPDGKPLPKSSGGGLRKHTAPPNVAELRPPAGAGILRLSGPASRLSVKLK